jgi:ribosomal protein S27E
MSNSWYTSKLGNGTAAVPPTPPVAQPQPVPYNPIPQQPQTPQQPQAMPQSAMTAARCPGCGSGNYGSGDPSIKARCYDCGYPIVQSGSGLGKGVTGPQASGPAQPARQTSTANNFNPQGIIGHI